VTHRLRRPRFAPDTFDRLHHLGLELLRRLAAHDPAWHPPLSAREDARPPSGATNCSASRCSANWRARLPASRENVKSPTGRQTGPLQEPHHNERPFGCVSRGVRLCFVPMELAGANSFRRPPVAGGRRSSYGGSQWCVLGIQARRVAGSHRTEWRKRHETVTHNTCPAEQW